MRRILLWLLTLTIALPSLARDFKYTYEGQTLTYTIIDEAAKTCAVKSCSIGQSGDLSIPSTAVDGANTYSVISIGYCAFKGCSSLTSVTISNSVTLIDEYAFDGCSLLKSITIPNSVTSIGYAAFSSCRSLTSVTIPNSVTKIEGSTFYECWRLSSVIIPSSVTSIGYSAFQDCRGLTSVTIPSSVTSIGTGAFRSCSSLKSVTIPNSVTSIANSAFYGCSNLISVTIPNSVTNIGDYAFYYCEKLAEIYCLAVEPPACEGSSSFYNVRTSCKVFVPAQSVDAYRNAAVWKNFTNIVGVDSEPTFTVGGVNYEKLTNKDGCVKVTGADATLSSLAIPATVQKNGKDYQVVEIAEKAFEKNSALTQITIPASIVDIKSGAFKGCTSLSKLTLLDGSADLRINNIWVNNGNSDSAEGEHAFRNCPLKEVYIGRNLRYIPDIAYGWSPFAYTPIETATFGEGVTNFPLFLFYKCNKLSLINIPSTLTEIEYNNFGEYGFRTCSALNNINVDPANTSYTSVDGVLYDKNQSKLLLMPASNATASFEIPSSVTEIGRYALHNCKNLNSVTIPTSISKIGVGAFYGCTGLQTVVYEATRPIEINEENIESYYENVFSHETYSKAELWINSSAYQLVKKTNPWSQFANISYTTLVLNVSELTLAEGDTEQIAASTSKGEELTSGLVWTSSDSSVATVSDNGLVTAVGLGNTTITCKWISPKGEELSQTIAVEVKDFVLKIKLPNGYTELLGAARNAYKFRFGCEEGYSLHQAFIDDEDITAEITASSDFVYEVKPARKDRVLYAIFRSDVNTGIETTNVANTSNIKFVITEGHISIEGAQPGSEVRLYDINGRML